jgi:hypothetical protein
MNVPHYVNETKSDMRCIKSGWYAMNEDGNLSSGPFVSREECLSRGIQLTNRSTSSESFPRLSETASRLPTGDAGGLSHTSAFGRRLPEYVSVTDMKIEIKSSHALQFRLVVHMSWLPRPAPATPS